MDTPVVIVAPPPPTDDADDAEEAARALAEQDEREEEEARRRAYVDAQRRLTNGGAELVLGGARAAVPVGSLSFHGAGRPLGSSTSQSFDATGARAGYVRPTVTTFEVTAAYTRRYFAVGALFDIGGGIGPDATPTSANAANVVGGGSITVVSGGFELYGVLPLRPVTLRVGTVAGVREAALQLRGFELTTCRSKAGTFPCTETASAVSPFLEPRVTADVSLPSFTRGDPPVALAFGGWAGVDVAPAYGWSAGLGLTVRVPYWAQRP